jgi:hypothetical protein
MEPVSAILSLALAPGTTRLPACPLRSLQGPGLTNHVTTWTQCPITKTRSRTQPKAGSEYERKRPTLWADPSEGTKE